MMQSQFNAWCNGVAGSNFVPNHWRARLLRKVGLDVAEGAVIWPGMKLTHRPQLKIETRTNVSAGCHIAGRGLLTIRTGVAIGPGVTIITSTHQLGPPSRRAGPVTHAPVLIEEGSWIGGGVMILAGVTIGRGAVVAAKSLVTKDVPPNTLVGGTPARVIRELDAGESGA